MPNMKIALLVLLLGVARVCAAPFLVSDPYVPQSDPNLNPVQFVIQGIGAAAITVQATTLSGGNIVLQYDLSTLPNGQYTVSAAAINIFGGESTFSAPPFAFTKGVPSPPTNLRISPTLLTWVPSFMRIRPISRPSPLRPPLVPSFS